LVSWAGAQESRLAAIDRASVLLGNCLAEKEDFSEK
jgi:hypothetical protein